MTTSKKGIDPKASAAQQAAANAEIDAEAEASGLPAEAALDQADPYAPADAGKGPGPISPAVTMGPATTTDIPPNEPYPVGKPYEPTYAEINGLPPAADAIEEA